MPHWVLIGIFSIHLIVFLYLAVKRREGYFVLVSLTFLLLVLSFSLRLWMPAFEIKGHKVHWYLRIGAWFTAGLSVLWIVRRRFAIGLKNL